MDTWVQCRRVSDKNILRVGTHIVFIWPHCTHLFVVSHSGTVLFKPIQISGAMLTLNMNI